MAATIIQEGVMRVGVTIRKDTHPAWYALLSNITSGQARAEVLRAHLLPPAKELFDGIPTPSPTTLDELSDKHKIRSKVSETTGKPDTLLRKETKQQPSNLDDTPTLTTEVTPDDGTESLANLVMKMAPGGI